MSYRTIAEIEPADLAQPPSDNLRDGLALALAAARPNRLRMATQNLAAAKAEVDAAVAAERAVIIAAADSGTQLVAENAEMKAAKARVERAREASAAARAAHRREVEAAGPRIAAALAPHVESHESRIAAALRQLDAVLDPIVDARLALANAGLDEGLPHLLTVAPLLQSLARDLRRTMRSGTG